MLVPGGGTLGRVVVGESGLGAGSSFGESGLGVGSPSGESGLGVGSLSGESGSGVTGDVVKDLNTD